MEIASTKRSGVFADETTDADSMEEAIIDDGCGCAAEKIGQYTSGRRRLSRSVNSSTKALLHPEWFAPRR
jgi:hypothetical protein